MQFHSEEAAHVSDQIGVPGFITKNDTLGTLNEALRNPRRALWMWCFLRR